MSTDSPEHQCRQGHRCKARVRDDDGAFHGAGVEDANTLCRPCEFAAFDAIRALAQDYAALRVARTRVRSHISGPKVSGSSQRSIPIALAADTLMSDIDLETLRWAVRITRGDPIPGDDCFAVLCAHLGTLIGLPAQQVTVWVPHPDGGDGTARAVYDGVDAVLRLARLHQRAQAVLELDEPRVQWLRESCHVCGYCTLTSSIPEATISCKSCRNVWDQDVFAGLNNPLLAVA